MSEVQQGPEDEAAGGAPTSAITPLVSIKMSVVDVLSYAGAYNGRPIVTSLTIKPISGAALDDLEVRLTLRSVDEVWSDEWVMKVDSLGASGLPFMASDLARFRPRARELLRQRTMRRAEIEATVSRAGKPIGTLTVPTTALAASGWVMSDPLALSVPNLAAFVQPHEPVLADVLVQASELLTRAGALPSIEGYQTGRPERVDQITDAVYESLRSRRLTYANPPASWDLFGNPDTDGQRVRVAGEVLREGLATCLDSSVLLCSALELAGLRPIIVVIPRHAFVGYWRHDLGASVDGVGAQFPRPVMAILEVKSMIDSGMIALIETTTMCGGSSSTPAAGARIQAAQRLDNIFDSLEAGQVGFEGEAWVVDVTALRYKGGVLPLPVRTDGPEGAVTVTEYRAAEASIDRFRESISRRSGGVAARVAGGDAPPRIKRWQESLLDLSRRNPLLNYRFPERSSIALFAEESGLGAIEDLLQSGGKLSLLHRPTLHDGRPWPLSDRRTTPPDMAEHLTRRLVNDRAVYTSATEDVYPTRMRRMLTSARSVVEETGSNGLYLALGMVTWFPKKVGGAHAAPLILVPVTLTPKNRNREFDLQLDPTGAITPNFSLAERLKQEFDLDLPKLIEPETDQAGIDLDGLIAYVRAEFLRAGLRDFRVEPAAVLGFFDFSTYRLWRDLQQHWPRFMATSPLVSHLVETPTRGFVDPAVPEEPSEALPLDDFAAALPILADASQAASVRDAMDGRTFVLQGPPGSGKSQTITNLLARALHSGKRVLFVAEKAGALSVVRDRLHSVGLGAFGLNLHDKGMRPADVRRQLSEALDASTMTDRIGYDASQRDIDRALAPLQQYPERLHSVGRLGESAYSARDKLLAVPVDSALPVPSAFLDGVTPEQVDDVRRAWRDARDVAARAGTSTTNSWSFVRSGIVDASTRQPIVDAVDSIDAAWAASAADTSATAFLHSIDRMEDLLGLGTLARRAPDLPTADAAATPQAAEGRASARTFLSAFDAQQIVAGGVPRTLDAPVDDLRASAQTALGSFFIGRGKRVALVIQRTHEYLGDRTPIAAAELLDVITAIESLQKFVRDYRVYIEAMPGVTVPPAANLLELEQRRALLERLDLIENDVRLVADDGSSRAARLRALVGSGASSSAAIGRLSDALGSLLELLPGDASSFDRWRAGRACDEVLAQAVPAWRADALDRDLIALRRRLELRVLLAPLEALGLHDATAAIEVGSVPAQDADMAFERGYLTAVLRRQLDEQSLDAFDGERHDALARDFVRAADSLRQLSPGVLAEDMISNRGFRPGVDVGAVGELRRELGRQRGHKPVRRLLRDHWAVISRVTPLVLAVPDALVRFVDGDLEPFDLVVFDEASQIKVAHSIGALGRARAAVVVGDSKQMPPTLIAQTGASSGEEEATGEEDNSAVPIDEESILTECLQARVPETYLTWHYRSEDETLIAFSNQTYYEGRLRTLPAPSRSLVDKGLSFVPVDGRFVRQTKGAGGDRGTNRAEAEAIVAEIVGRVENPRTSKHSIGVVTFNKPQQELIQTLLLETENEAVLTALNPDETEEPITVWNLETVQGHERDVILFSIAFSKDETGRLNRNFGPLTHVGGERRLNVAVTRARRQVIVYCSFAPEDLRAEGLSEGLQQLADYLRLAKYGPRASAATGATRVSAPDRHRDEIADALRARGLRVGTEVGLSEFKVDIALARAADEGDWSVGLLTDGPAWRSRATVGDRDALPLTLLADRMAWPAITRVWSPDWLRDREGVLDRIETLVDGIEAGVRQAPSVDSAVASEVSTEPVDYPIIAAAPASPQDAPLATRAEARARPEHPSPEAAALQWREWSPRQLQPGWVLDQLHDRATRDHLLSVIRDIISVEGPVSVSRAAKHIGRMHGLGAVREARVVAIDAMIGDAFPRSSDGFLFSSEEPPARYVRWCASSAGTRKVEEISLIEISNAMRHIAAVGLGASRSELVTSAASMLGFSRISAGIRERLESAVDEGLRRGVLIERGAHLVAG